MTSFPVAAAEKFQADDIGTALQELGGFLTRRYRLAVDFQQTIPCNTTKYVLTGSFEHIHHIAMHCGVVEVVEREEEEDNAMG
jgi:hypothetical protein